MAVCVGRVAGRGLDISLRFSVLLFGAMGSFESGWLTQEREVAPFSLRLSLSSVWGLELGVTSLLGLLKCLEEKFLELVVCEWVATSASRLWFLCTA